MNFTINISPRRRIMKYDERIIGGFAPTVPMWAVYYDLEKGDIMTSKVVVIAITEDNVPGDELRGFVPMVMLDYIVDPRLIDGFLGFALDYVVNKEDYEYQIRMYKLEKLGKK